jgi:hypothetical protein
LIQRMIGAAMLRTGTYEEVETDTSATMQAMLVVVVVSLASGIGNVGVGGFMALVFGVLASLAGWSFWAWITYFVGTKILPTPETHANWGQLARTLGYAQTPGLFKIFGFLPGIGPIIFFLASIWQLVAIRQALDYSSTWRAIAVAVIGFIGFAVVTGIVMVIFVSPVIPGE